MSSFNNNDHQSNFPVKEATIKDLETAFQQNKLTSKELVLLYMQQIEKLNPVLRAVIEINPDALELAEEADKRREKAKESGSNKDPGLDGIPILVKDNIATKDKMNTTAGSYVLLGLVVPRDAGVVEKLRKAGAIILGKASLSEWANFRSSHAPSGWCARGGQGRNPYNLSETPSGSSSGSAIAVAANLVAVTLGTETDGSILSPSSANSVVGIKPTLGLTSRGGVIPITPTNCCRCNLCSGLHYNEEMVMEFGFKIALNSYLKQLIKSPVRSLADVIEFNNKNSQKEMIEELGQEIFLSAEATTGIGPEENKLLETLEEWSRDWFEKVMVEHELDAMVTPDSSFSSVLAIGGYPGISVPAGYDKYGVPFGICFGGIKGTEPKLIEQATKIRKPPFL
ncbi:hypothetical protein SOVF_053120 [Spinacia oleracea]|nr:hypothetical protein SOVF_053120 [Spinacia oleracea]